MIIRNKNNSFTLLFAWYGTILPTVLPALAIVVILSTILVYLSSHHFFQVPSVPAIGFTILGLFCRFSSVLEITPVMSVGGKVENYGGVVNRNITAYFT